MTFSSPNLSSQRVLLVCGGNSPEHSISLLTAQNIAAALRAGGHQVTIVGIAKDSGIWRELEFLPLVEAPASPGTTLQTVTDEVGKPFNLADMNTHFDVAFPVLHGPNGEDGTVQGLFASLGMPYTGASVTTSALCMDKRLLKDVARTHGIPQVPYIAVHASQIEAVVDRSTVLTSIQQSLAYPIFVKPSRMGSSVGVSKCQTPAELLDATALALTFGDYVLYEQGLEDFREIETGILGDTDCLVSLPGETVHSDDWYDFDAKYMHSITQHCPADVTPDVQEQCDRISRQVWRLIEGRGLCRIDFFLKDGVVYLNEVNTLPGQTAQSLYPALMQSAGVDMRDVVNTLITIALATAKRPQATP